MWSCFVAHQKDHPKEQESGPLGGGGPPKGASVWSDHPKEQESGSLGGPPPKGTQELDHPKALRSDWSFGWSRANRSEYKSDTTVV